MNGLRTLRIILAAIFLAASVGCLFIPGGFIPQNGLAWHVQIVPSALGATLGATLFWILMSFFAGRIYCSTVCPVGTISDLASLLRRKTSKNARPFSFREPVNLGWDRLSLSKQILILYILSLVCGILVVAFVIEPWNMMRNLASVVNPAATSSTWKTIGISSAAGMIAGVVTIGCIVIWSFFSGRKFCTTVCPIGTALGLTDGFQVFHIEIDPDKCINCMKCEDVCSAECVKVLSRHVDNGRCIRCFDCLNVCPNDAIRMQINRNRRATPMMKSTRAR